ncbi:hypothetical protein [Streptomyces sp. NBC_01233]|uniref:hypothetical protein n=1 Tax=Streptomyces sp. NBC_01233 TaxID=2903787 RepID=UPI002E0F2FBA|nr:hypothetical protein OG332_14230 [Streptomyces sp. NBC_01233]
MAGRISADALVAMGYRDAWDYLDSAEPSGVAKDPTCTAMRDAPRGVRFRECMRGEIGGATSPGARLVGHVDHEPWGGRALLADGRIESDNGGLTYVARARPNGTWQEV